MTADRRPSNGAVRVLDRPRGFYITDRLDRELDRAVEYLRTRHGLRKVDRSTLVTVLLDRGELWTDAALDGLVDQVVTELTGRLVRKTG